MSTLTEHNSQRFQLICHYSCSYRHPENPLFVVLRFSDITLNSIMHPVKTNIAKSLRDGTLLVRKCIEELSGTIAIQ